jgi:glycine/D-amino acid oxidase-like deaminating enzyme
MSDSPHIVIVGAGIIGASIAWHLVSAGARVTVVDGGEGGGVATANSFAWINASWGNPEPYFRLRVRAMAEWRRLATEVPSLPLAWTGGLCWDLPPEQLDAYAKEHASWGYGVRRVGRAEARQIEPNLSAPPDFALHVREEGMVEPAVAARVLLSDAENRGAHLQLRTPVAGLVRRHGKIAGLKTTAGPIFADDVVLAAGAGTPRLLATVGLDLPLRAPPGLLVHSRPHKRLLKGVVIAPPLHMRQTSKGRLVSGSDFGGADPGDDPKATARALFDATRKMLRDADALAMDFFSIGYRPTPADGFPAIGRVGGRGGPYVAVMHSGITLAPAVGLFVADELFAERRDPLLMPYGPERLLAGRPGAAFADARV